MITIPPALTIFATAINEMYVGLKPHPLSSLQNGDRVRYRDGDIFRYAIMIYHPGVHAFVLFYYSDNSFSEIDPIAAMDNGFDYLSLIGIENLKLC